MNGGFAPVYTRGASAFADAFCMKSGHLTIAGVGYGNDVELPKAKQKAVEGIGFLKGIT